MDLSSGCASWRWNQPMDAVNREANQRQLGKSRKTTKRMKKKNKTKEKEDAKDGGIKRRLMKWKYGVWRRCRRLTSPNLHNRNARPRYVRVDKSNCCTADVSITPRHFSIQFPFQNLSIQLLVLFFL